MPEGSRSSSDSLKGIKSHELEALVKELQWMKGFYIGKLYETGEDEFRIRLTRSGESADLRIVLTKAINRTRYVEEQKTASGFAMALRNVLENAKIMSIEQLNNDRIVAMGLEKGGASYIMIIEMFGKGNLVITDSSMSILLAYKIHKFADRNIAKGELYVPPKPGVAKQKEMEAAQPAKSIEEMLDSTYHEEKMSKESEQDVEHRKKEEEIVKSIEKQERIIDEAEKEVEQARLAGEYLMNNMVLVNSMIEHARKNKHITQEEMTRIFPSVKVKRIDLKDKTITIIA